MLRFTNLLKDSFPVTVVLLSGLAFASGQTSLRPLPTEELEKYDDPPNYVSRTGVSPAMISQHDAFTSIQVNVNASGQNITGDAANEPSITVDPNNGNKMTIGWRQFNSVTSNFRQAGWGYTTNAGASWTFPGVLENNVFRSDPVLDSDSTSNFFYLSLLETFFDNMWRSTDGGMNWTNIAPAKGGDKQWFTIDNTAAPGMGFNTSPGAQVVITSGPVNSLARLTAGLPGWIRSISLTRRRGERWTLIPAVTSSSAALIWEQASSGVSARAMPRTAASLQPSIKAPKLILAAASSLAEGSIQTVWAGKSFSPPIAPAPRQTTISI
jgi:hypothetical protein